VPQRMQLLRSPGAIAGTIWNSPQPGHSRSCGLVIRARAACLASWKDL